MNDAKDKDKPVNFDRLLKYCKTIHKYNPNVDKILHPWQIIEISKVKMHEVEIIDKSIITENFYNELSELRVKFGLPSKMVEDQEEAPCLKTPSEIVKYSIIP